MHSGYPSMLASQLYLMLGCQLQDNSRGGVPSRAESGPLTAFTHFQTILTHASFHICVSISVELISNSGFTRSGHMIAFNF